MESFRLVLWWLCFSTSFLAVISGISFRPREPTPASSPVTSISTHTNGLASTSGSISSSTHEAGTQQLAEGYVISQQKSGLCNQMIAMMYHVRLAYLFNLTLVLPRIRGSLRYLIQPRSTFDTYWDANQFTTVLHELGVRVIPSLDNLNVPRNVRLVIPAFRNKAGAKFVIVNEVVRSSRRIIERAKATGIPFKVSIPFTWWMRFPKVSMDWFTKLYSAYAPAPHLLTLAKQVVQALGGEGGYNALHIRHDNVWCMFAFKHHHCREMEMNCAVTAILNAKKQGLFDSRKVLFVAAASSCDDILIRNLSSLIEMKVVCSDKATTLSPDLVRSKFYDKAVIDQYVLTRSDMFFGRAGSSFTFVVMAHRHYIHQYARSRNLLYTATMNLQTYGCFGLPCGYLKDVYDDGSWNAERTRESQGRYAYSSLTKPCCRDTIPYYNNSQDVYCHLCPKRGAAVVRVKEMNDVAG